MPHLWILCKLSRRLKNPGLAWLFVFSNIIWYLYVVLRIFQDLGKYGLLFYNALFSLLPAACFAWYTEELQSVSLVYTCVSHPNEPIRGLISPKRT